MYPFIIYVLFCQEKWIFPGWQNMLWSHHWATARLCLNCVNFPAIFRSIHLWLSYVPASKVLMHYIVGMLTATSSSFTPVLFVAKENQFNNTVVHIWNKQHTAQMFYDAFIYCITQNYSKKFKLFLMFWSAALQIIGILRRQLCTHSSNTIQHPK